MQEENTAPNRDLVNTVTLNNSILRPGEVNSILLPLFIAPNPEQVSVILRDASQFAVINSDNVDAAEFFIQAAKKVIRLVSGERLNYTRKLDDIKKEAMAAENSLDDVIAPVEAGIKSEKQRQYNEAQARRKELERQEQECQIADQKEADRKKSLALSLVDLENQLTNQLFAKNSDLGIDNFCNSIIRAKVKPEVYQERTEEAQAIMVKVAGMRDEAKKALADAQEAELANQKRIQEAADRKKQVELEAVQNNLALARDADLRTQVATQSVAQVQNIVVKKVAVIENTLIIPRQYMIPDLKLINEAINQGIEIPGVAVTEEVRRSGK